MRLYIVGDTQSTKCKVFTTQREAEIYVAEELRANEFNGLWYEYLKYIQEYNGPMDEINDFRDFLWNKFIYIPSPEKILQPGECHSIDLDGWSICCIEVNLAINPTGN